MRAVLSSIVLVLLLSAGSVAEESSSESTGTLIDLELIDTLLEKQVELWERDGKTFDLPKKPVTMRVFSRGLSKEIAERMVRRDGWGNDFMVMGKDDHLIVVSSGPDGASMAIQSLQDDEPMSPNPRIREIVGDDILLVLGEGIFNGPETNMALQKRSMADLRSIGTAIESFSIDNNVYPRQDRDLLPVELIEGSLSPVYIRRLALLDGWGNQFLMWGTEREYVIMSLGVDGVPDQYYGFAEGNVEPFPFRGAFTDSNGDIVFSNGRFVQWPEGMQPYKSSGSCRGSYSWTVASIRRRRTPLRR